MNNISMIYGKMSKKQKDLFKGYMREIFTNSDVGINYKMTADQDTLHIRIEKELAKTVRQKIASAAVLYLKEKELPFVLIFETVFEHGNRDVFLLSKNGATYVDIEAIIKEKTEKMIVEMEKEISEKKAREIAQNSVLIGKLKRAKKKSTWL